MVYKIHHVRNGDLSDSSEEQIKDFMKFRKKKKMWGSKNVVENWIEFRGDNNKSRDGMQLLKKAWVINE